MNPPTATSSDPEEAQTTGFRALRTWRGIYLLVLGIFIVWVTLLTVLSRTFQ